MTTRRAAAEYRTSDAIEIFDERWCPGTVRKVTESGIVEVAYTNVRGQNIVSGVQSGDRGRLLRAASNTPRDPKKLSRELAEEHVAAPNSDARSAKRKQKGNSSTRAPHIRGEERKRLVTAALDAYVKRENVNGVLIDTLDKAAQLINPDWTHHYINRDWKVYVAERHAMDPSELDDNGEEPAGDGADEADCADGEGDVAFDDADLAELKFDAVCERDARAARAAAAIDEASRASRGRPLKIIKFLRRRDTRLAKMKAVVEWAAIQKLAPQARPAGTTIQGVIDCARKQFEHAQPIPKSTVSRLATAYNKDGSLPKAPGAPAALPLEIERALVKICIEMADHYCGLEQQHVCVLAGTLISSHPWLPTLFKDGIPGAKWFAGFKFRWGDVVGLKLWDTRETRRAKWATYENFAAW